MEQHEVDQVVAVEADGPAVVLRDGRRIACATLVVCPGLEEDWDAVPGLAEAYAAGWAGSTFVVETAPQVWPALRDLTTERVVFTMPPEPAPCGATALKPLFMAHNLAAADADSFQHYDGYTVMPITVGRHRLMLVEVDRDGRPTPSVPFPDLVRPRRLTWFADRYGLPLTYFKRILRGKV